jgi:hypothetical protein
MSDSSAVQTALVAKLAGDQALADLLPDGVFFGDAAQGATAFVLVSLVIGADERMFNARAWEAPIYLVQAVHLSTSGVTADNAAKRIDELLDDGSLTIEGYTLMHMARAEYIRGVEPDTIDPSLRWQHAGGRYEVMVSE